MLQGIIIKKVIDLVMKQLMKQFKLEKFEKILNYVEKPNDLDKQMDALYKKVDKYGKCIEGLEKDLAEIKKVAHEPIEGLTGRLKDLEKKARF